MIDSQPKQCKYEKCQSPTVAGYIFCDKHITRPGRLMFTIWAIERSTGSEGTHMLDQATMHLHVSDVLDGIIPPIKGMRTRKVYEQQYMLRLLTVWKDRARAQQA